MQLWSCCKSKARPLILSALFIRSTLRFLFIHYPVMFTLTSCPLSNSARSRAHLLLACTQTLCSCSVRALCVKPLQQKFGSEKSLQTLKHAMKLTVELVFAFFGAFSSETVPFALVWDSLHPRYSPRMAKHYSLSEENSRKNHSEKPSSGPWPSQLICWVYSKNHSAGHKFLVGDGKSKQRNKTRNQQELFWKRGRDVKASIKNKTVWFILELKLDAEYKKIYLFLISTYSYIILNSTILDTLSFCLQVCITSVISSYDISCSRWLTLYTVKSWSVEFYSSKFYLLEYPYQIPVLPILTI